MVMVNLGKTVVLVADDEPSMRAMVSQHLRTRGYKVVQASDGDEAYALACEHLPQIVLLDVMMPGRNGWEVARRIRETVSLAHTGIIMLTGIGENLNQMTSPLYGADAFLDKPFEFAVLDRLILETIERRKDTVGRLDGADVEIVHTSAFRRFDSEPGTDSKSTKRKI
jgi:DNA-binding response OmpR family regulator